MKRIEEFEVAAVALSWIGSRPMDEWAGIRERYAVAKKALRDGLRGEEDKPMFPDVQWSTRNNINYTADVRGEKVVITIVALDEFVIEINGNYVRNACPTMEEAKEFAVKRVGRIIQGRKFACQSHKR